MKILTELLKEYGYLLTRRDANYAYLNGKDDFTSFFPGHLTEQLLFCFKPNLNFVLFSYFVIHNLFFSYNTILDPPKKFGSR